MLESFNSNQKFEYQKLTEDEQKSRGILGRLVGAIADGINPTRNGRKYSTALWEKVFKDPIMQEKIDTRTCFGELGHPVDRTETDPEKIAICLAEVPKKGPDGKLYGVFDILSTPNGKILKSLCDYGCSIGVSSRGSGDTFIDVDGQTAVDPDTYECECWDAVLLPAVKAARLQYVTESLDSSHKKTLTESLNELVDGASEEDKKIMQSTIKELNLNSIEEDEKINQPEKDDIDVAEEPEEATNNGDEVVKQLQDALKESRSLKDKITQLQEKLSGCYATESKQEEKIEKYRDTISRLTESVNKVKMLELKVSQQSEIISQQNSEIKKLNEAKSSSQSKLSLLNENLTNSKDTICDLNGKLKSLNTTYNTLKEDYNNKVSTLTEQIQSLKQDIEIRKAEYSHKLETSNSIVEKYKRIAKSAVNHYIESQATKIGVSANEIKNRLSKNYTFGDIDAICEQLQQYKLNVSKLPFMVENIDKAKMKISAPKPSIIKSAGVDDDIDDQLISLMENINKN